MNNERLQLMVTMLNEVLAGTWKPAKISLNNSFGPSTNGDQFYLGSWVTVNEKVDCGFSACACGHAALDSRFRKMGLGLDFCQGNYDITFDGHDSFDAVKEFFGFAPTEELEEDNLDEIAYILFAPSAYPIYLRGNKLIVQVIRRIEKLLELGEDKFFKRFDRFDRYSASENASERLISKAGRIYKSTQE